MTDRYVVDEAGARVDYLRDAPLKAHVRNGRLVLDEPTDLPEGDVIYLQPVDADVGDGDGFNDDERAALLRALDEGIAAARNGEHGDADELVRDLLARR